MMVESAKGRELVRLSVRWPLTIKMKSGDAHGETRNITGEGMFLYCSERLHEGIVYPMTIKLPEKRVEMTGKVTWSNLNNCTSLNLNSAMGFYFMKIDGDEGRQSLRAAIVAECRKPLRMRQGADQLTDAFPSNRTQVSASFGDSREY